MKMQAEIGRVKDESAEMVDNAAEACQQATANLNEAALVNPDGTFSPQGKTAVTEVVVDAVTNMQGIYHCGITPLDNPGTDKTNVHS